MTPVIFTDFLSLPGTLRVEHLAAIYDVRPQTVRDGVRRLDPSYPTPFMDRPYRWRKVDVEKHYHFLTMSVVRRARDAKRPYRRLVRV